MQLKFEAGSADSVDMLDSLWFRAGTTGTRTASKFYAPFDGVQPPVSGWSAGDWLKVQDGIRVKVEAGGLPPTPSGLGLVWACWSDNPTDSDYVKCGGHKAEPH